MTTPINSFKQALADAYSAELCAGAGFDWLLIDGEHAPNDLRSILGQLQAIAPYASHPIARIPVGSGHVGTTLVKQYLDLGVQTLLVPMVDTPEQAADLVRAMRYPPQGIRGMAGARASRWGRNPDYVHEANAQVCLLVQAETELSLRHLDAIAGVQGVDGVFIGPADLSASMGHAGNPGHPNVQAAIADGIARIVKAGKAAGILTPDESQARRYLELGATFVAVGLDTNVLAQTTSALAARFKSGVSVAPASQTY